MGTFVGACGLCFSKRQILVCMEGERAEGKGGGRGEACFGKLLLTTWSADGLF